MRSHLIFLVQMSRWWCSVLEVLVDQEDWMQRSSSTVALSCTQSYKNSGRTYPSGKSG